VQGLFGDTKDPSNLGPRPPGRSRLDDGSLIANLRICKPVAGVGQCTPAGAAEEVGQDWVCYAFGRWLIEIIVVATGRVRVQAVRESVRAGRVFKFLKRTTSQLTHVRIISWPAHIGTPLDTPEYAVRHRQPWRNRATELAAPTR
jgi:hypothetical protein